MIRPLLLLSLVLAAGAAAAIPDTVREQRWATHWRQNPSGAEIIELRAGGRPFLAIDTPAADTPARGAVILLHDRGAHPDWPDVIHPLRARLPSAGWRTLSIQLPLPAGDDRREAYAALFPEGLDRIRAAFEHLRGDGSTRIAVVGHGLGAALGAAFVASHLDRVKDGTTDDPLRAFVGIGMPPGTETSLARIGLPLLDLYGMQDLDEVRRNAPRRRQAALGAGNRAYRQDRIPGADHVFTGLEDTLATRVERWLRRQMPAPSP